MLVRGQVKVFCLCAFKQVPWRVGDAGRAGGGRERGGRQGPISCIIKGLTGDLILSFPLWTWLMRLLVPVCQDGPPAQLGGEGGR